MSLENIAKHYNLDLLILFGSQAHKKIHAESDIDIAFYRQKWLTDNEQENLLSEIMDFYKRADIDLVDISKNQSALLRHQIFTYGEPLFEKHEGLFQTMRWQAYIDFEDFKRFYLQKSDLLDIQLKN